MTTGMADLAHGQLRTGRRQLTDEPRPVSATTDVVRTLRTDRDLARRDRNVDQPRVTSRKALSKHEIGHVPDLAGRHPELAADHRAAALNALMHDDARNAVVEWHGRQRSNPAALLAGNHHRLGHVSEPVGRPDRLRPGLRHIDQQHLVDMERRAHGVEIDRVGVVGATRRLTGRRQERGIDVERGHSCSIAGSSRLCTTATRLVARVSATYSERIPCDSSSMMRAGSTTTAGLDESARIYGLESAEAFIRHQEPLGRLIAPDEIAAAIAWLCSPASSAITGAVLPVDGGMTATP
ncbi:MAG: SDR family oxidoreductase [Acidimicrobiia bacterium]|nr:SDR family oxidoreductase [Acidimicrobiia bacterium]